MTIHDTRLNQSNQGNDCCFQDNDCADDILAKHRVTRRWISLTGCLFSSLFLLKDLQRWLSRLPLAFPMTSRNIQVTICLLNTALCNTQTKILPVREGVGASSRYRVSERSLQFRKLPLSITTVILNMYCRLALFLHLNKPSMGFENGRAGKSWCFAEEILLSKYSVWLMFSMRTVAFMFFGYVCIYRVD